VTLLLSFLGNRWGQMIAVAAAAYFYGFYSVPRVDIKALELNTIQARDAYWQTKLADQARTLETQISEWQRKAEEAEAAHPTPTDQAGLAKLCEGDALCRK
jgi:hypothetical protein